MPAVWVVEVILAGGLLSSNTYGSLGVLWKLWVEPTSCSEKHFPAAPDSAGIILLIKIRAGSPLRVFFDPRWLELGGIHMTLTFLKH